MRKLLFAFLCATSLFAQDNGNVFRFRLGDLQIAAIKDQNTNMGRSILTDPDSAIANRLLADDQNPSSINCFLIVPTNADENITLIDTGLGGGLFDGLKTLKIPPENIGSILITHMHRDHIGGLTKDGAPLFANAIVYVPKNDLAYWQFQWRDRTRLYLLRRLFEFL
ncbi:hypothetical protein FACS189487_06020 [Campylobacterota bacterium]|nr:hypothetical protein FACS189487_06020 [Campylobacterota bacterium]